MTVLRPIVLGDAPVIAAMHAASWRSAYRGILRDDFLDGALESMHRDLWAQRLAARPPAGYGFIALVDESPTGFAFAFDAIDPRWGTQLDNLHVLPHGRGKGIGRALLSRVCEVAQRRAPGSGIFLWVYERNELARAFYERLGARAVERKSGEAPGGGVVPKWRYAWPDAGRAIANVTKGASPCK
jgi:ribosomal protein S18 acetylase RimI-like enzyme